MSSTSLNRRDFARLFAYGGSAALMAHPAIASLRPRPLSAADLGPAPDWERVRDQFLMPRDLAVLNAANLCPTPQPTIRSVTDHTERMDRAPVPTLRRQMTGVKETTRTLLGEYLRVPGDDILVTRNTSESNNFVSNGLDLGPGDEVLIYAENHPSNNRAWKAKGERFGYTVVEVEPVNPHPGPDYYLEAFARAITPRTRVLSFTHLTNTMGDLFPARELCALARERGILSMVDGAQSFGLLDVDLSEIRPDFYSGSGHKWPCGPKEVGVLYVSPAAQEQFHASIYSAYTGQSGLSRTHEGMGQRDEPAIQGFGDQLRFLQEIGRAEIEARSRELASALIEGLQSIDGTTLWTSPDPNLRVAVVSFQPGNLEPGRVLAALEEDGVVAATRGGERPGIRFSPHYYNTMADIDRAVSSIGRYMRTGL